MNLFFHFRSVSLKGIGEASVEVEISAYFKGGSTANFTKKRQEALLAIVDAVKRTGAEFSVFNGPCPLFK